MKIEKIDITKICPDPNQPRKSFDKQKIDQLAESIKKYGLLQPVLLRREGEKFVIIAGERRFRACMKLNLQNIDSIVKDDENTPEIALIENIQREDLDPIEEALAIKRLKDDRGYTHEDIAKVLGKTRTYVTNKLRILGLDSKCKSYLKDGKISEGHARALLSEKDIKKRDEIVDRIINEGLNVRDIENIVKKSKKKKSFLDEEMSSAKELLEDVLSTKVDINSKDNNTGKISIEFYSYDQLKDIVNYILEER